MPIQTPKDTLSLVDLPVELVEYVVESLCLQDIRHLRLVNRIISQNASQGRFRTYCEKKAVDLRKASLDDLGSQITPGNVACNLQDLTITGLLCVTKTVEKVIRTRTIPADQDDILAQRTDAMGNDRAVRPTRLPASRVDLAQAEKELKILQTWQADAGTEKYDGHDVESLFMVFDRIHQHGKTGSLRSITLKVSVIRSTTRRLPPERGGDRRPVWRIAAHTFNATVAALNVSGLTTQRLDVFNNLNRCSLSGFDIEDTLALHASGSLVASFNALKSLSLSTSNRCVPAIGYCKVLEADPDDVLQDFRHDGNHPTYEQPDPVKVGELEDMVRDPKDATGLARLVIMMPNLEDLDLHAYQLYHPHLHEPLAFMDWHSAAIFHNVAETVSLHKLKKLTLRGWTLHAEDLLALLRANPGLHSVDFRKIALDKGVWRSVIDYLCNADNNLEYLHFDVLFERSAYGAAYLEFPGAFFTVAPDGQSTFTLDGRDAVLGGVQYGVRQQWVVGCQQHSAWRQETRRLYGPPQGGRG